MANINTQGPPDQAALEAQLVQMQTVVPCSELRGEYENPSAAARHRKTLLNRLSFKPNPIFTWVSAEDTTWSTQKLKHASTRRLAIILWKEGVIGLLKEPVNNYPNAQSQTKGTSSTAMGSISKRQQQPKCLRETGTSECRSCQIIGGDVKAPSDDPPPSPSLANTQAESAPAFSSKRKGEQPVLPSKAPKTKGNQDIRKFFNRISSAS